MSVLLLSGGIDSLALLFWRRPKLAITVNYGQKPAQAEIDVSSHVCRELSVTHEVITLDCASLGLGDLAGKEPSPLSQAPEWWPFRNQFLITVAGMRMVALEERELLIGSVKSDRVHADGSEEFFTRIDGLLTMQEGNMRVVAPGLNLSSVELVKSSNIPTSLLAWAHSCLQGNTACGVCRGCSKHRQVFTEVGISPNT